LLVVFLLCGCGNVEKIDSENLSKNEIELKYKEMENKLIEYGKLVYENEQWLNENAVEITTAMTLKDLSERNGYDITMFINPETKEKCNIDNTKIEFIINDVSDLNNIKYKFNPILVCGDDEETSGDSVNDKYSELYEKFISYVEEFYDIKNIESKNLSVGEYKVTLKDLQDKNYDVEIFKDPDTGKQCDLEESYSLLNVSIIDDKKDYKFNYYLQCE